MPGARIIMNSRYFHIARPGEKADGKYCMTMDAASGLINYIGTREGVELNVYNQALNFDPLNLSPDVSSRAATKKQADTIIQLLDAIPEAKKSFEYQDYLQNKTIGNATELISHAAELGMGYAFGLGEATNLIEYIGKRPGVDRVGEHGLFSSAPQVDIKKAQEEIAACKGKIWTHVISLRREDADALGYNQQKPWRDLILQKLDIIARESNIPLSDLHWYAGMHNTTHHPHIHLVVFPDNKNSKAGKLTVQGISKIKAAFSEVIFADERHQIYVHKDDMREQIKSQIDAILSDAAKCSPSSQFTEKKIKEIFSKLQHLAAELKEQPGKMQYGWLKSDSIRKEINGIMSGLAAAPDIQKLYQLYCKDHIALESMYHDDPKDISPIVENKEFRSVKNKIIREAMKLSMDFGEEEAVLPCPENPEPFGSRENFKSLLDNIPPEQEPTAPEDYPDSVVPAGNESLAQDDYPEPFVPPDSESMAQDDYPDSIIPADSESMAQEDCSNSIIPADSESMAQENYPESFVPADSEPETDEDILETHHSEGKEDFKKVYFNAVEKREPEAMYQLAKRYFYGEGTDQNYVSAQMWYGLAAAGDNSAAKYELGKMYLYGIGIDKDDELGKEYCLEAYDDFTYDLQEETGISIEQDSFLWEELPEASSYCAYLEYLVGKMRLNGEGVEKNAQYAFDWFRAASLHGHVHSEYMLAKMLYDGNGVPQSYPDAADLFREAADENDKYACYSVGRMYRSGIGVTQNFTTAAHYFTKAAKQNVPYADYALAQMTETGQGIEQSEENAFMFYQNALDEFISQETQRPDSITEYRIGSMYLYGKGTNANPQTALEWFLKSAKLTNAFAAYQAAHLLDEGKGVAQDKAQAQQLYATVLDGLFQQDKENPNAQTEYRIGSMYLHGKGTEANPQIALEWFFRSAKLGNAFAAYQAARLLEEGKDVNQDETQAQELYETALAGFLQQEEDKPDAQTEYRIGSMYLYGKGTGENSQNALEWFLKSAKLGNAFAAYQAARILDGGRDVTQDEAQVQTLYTTALTGFLQQGKGKPDVQTEYRIGSMYLYGKGTDVNPQIALEWFFRSAKLGNAFAAYQAARLLEEGKDVNQDETQAQELYETALAGFLQQEEDKPDAQTEYRIGSMYLNGKGTDVNPQIALEWFFKSAKLGNAFAAYQAARLLEEGKVVAQDEAQAQTFYAAALAGFLQQEKDKPDAQTEYRIGSMFLHGKGTAENSQNALEWFLKSANLGNAFAAYQAAHLLEEGKDVAQDEVQAQELYATAIAGFLQQEKNKPNAQLEYRIGSMYLHGKGTDENPQTSLEWFLKSAKLGNAFAAYQAARLLEEGKDVARDETHAQELYATALAGFLQQEEDKPDAQTEYRIGSMYLHGKGTSENPQNALVWFFKSAKLGNAFAAYQAAHLLDQGKDVTQDETYAQKLYATALVGFLHQEKDEPDAQTEYRIGSMYLHGKGTDVNPQIALEWFLKSAKLGNAFAAYQAANLLDEGKDVAQDETYAHKLYAAALAGFHQQEKNKPDAQTEYRIGSMYLHGKGTGEIPQIALEWFLKSAKFGNAFAAYQAAKIFDSSPFDSKVQKVRAQIYYNLALNGFITIEQRTPDMQMEYTIAEMFESGKGTAVNHTAAFQWFHCCAEKGNPYAMFQIGRMLQSGSGISKNIQLAQTYYSAALRGFQNMLGSSPENTALLYRIGTMYQYGLGVNQDIATAKDLYRQAASDGSEAAAQRLNQMKLSEDQQAAKSVMGMFRSFARILGHNVEDSTTHKFQQHHKLHQKLSHKENQKQEML